MSIQIEYPAENLVKDWYAGNPTLEINLQESDDALVMDLYFPNIIKGTDGREVTNERLLEMLREIGGVGSGIDADTVDGLHASAFLRNTPALSGRVLMGGENGTVADGGTFQEFNDTFINCLQPELR